MKKFLWLLAVPFVAFAGESVKPAGDVIKKKVQFYLDIKTGELKFAGFCPKSSTPKSPKYTFKGKHQPPVPIEKHIENLSSAAQSKSDK